MPSKDGLSMRPWYAFCPRDFFLDPVVMLMSVEQRRAYRESLDLSWMSNTPGIGTEDDWRRMMGYTPSRWSKVRAKFEGAFEKENGRWVQKRLVEEAEVYLQSVARKSVAGKVGAESRWHSHGSRMAAACGSMADDGTDTGTRTRTRVVEDGAAQPDTPPPAAAPQPLEMNLQDVKRQTKPFLNVELAGGKVHTITEEDLAHWKERFPDVNVRQQVRNAVAKLETKPKRASKRGVEGWIVSWLTKEQDRPGISAAPMHAPTASATRHVLNTMTPLPVMSPEQIVANAARAKSLVDGLAKAKSIRDDGQK